MNPTTAALTVLFDRIPRRHSAENIHEINSIVTEYEDILIDIESINSFYEKNISPFFDELEDIKSTIKKSSEKKHAKKAKDELFDEASGSLKDTIQELIGFYADGKNEN